MLSFKLVLSCIIMLMVLSLFSCHLDTIVNIFKGKIIPNKKRKPNFNTHSASQPQDIIDYLLKNIENKYNCNTQSIDSLILFGLSSPFNIDDIDDLLVSNVKLYNSILTNKADIKTLNIDLIKDKVSLILSAIKSIHDQYSSNTIQDTKSDIVDLLNSLHDYLIKITNNIEKCQVFTHTDNLESIAKTLDSFIVETKALQEVYTSKYTIS